MKQSMQKKTTIEFKDLRNNFSILKKCKSKVYCLLLEMFFFINELRPSLNVQSDSARAKVFK